MTNTTTTTKLTKSTKFAMIRDYLSGENVSEDNIPMLIEFIDREIELLAKKNSGDNKKPTAVQTANEQLKADIYEAMEPDVFYTAADVMKLVPELTSTQKSTAMLNQMEKAGKVTKTTEKRRSYFAKVVE